MGSLTNADDDFAAFVREQTPNLLRACYLLTGNAADSEDLLQSTWLHVHRQWGQLAGPEAREAYVRRSLRNGHISVYRRGWRRLVSLGSTPEPVVIDCSEAFAVHDEVRSALAVLSPRARLAVVLRYYCDLSERETAETMRCSVGTVKSLTSRALVRMRAALTETAQDYAPLTARTTDKGST